MHPTNQPPSRDGWYWPWLLIGLLVVSSAGSILMVVIAVNDPSFAVEDNYYKKAVEWDKEMAKATKEHQLGWKLKLTLKPYPKRPRLRMLQATLHDAQGTAIHNAKIQLQAFHNAKASQKIKLQLTSQGKGNYQATILIHRPGLWIFRAIAIRGKQRFAMQTRKMLKPPSEKAPPKG